MRINTVMAHKFLTLFSTFNATAIFGPYVSPGTEIATYGDTDFEDVVTARWSAWAEPTFQAAIKPATEIDLQNIVTIAANLSIPFLAVNTGHGTGLGYGNVANALNINLGNFNSVTVDADNNLLIAGGGVNFGDVFPVLYDAGKELQTGNSECVGLVGATIGGGIGALQGLHGLILDALVSVRIITASGSLVTASATENPDLFWAIRGAGANFGIITEATYTLHDQTNNGYVSLGEFVFPGSLNGSLWEILHTFDDYLPPNLALIISGGFNHTINSAYVTAGVIYFGPLAEAQAYFDQFIALGPVSQVVLNTTTLAMYDLLSATACTDGERHNDYTLGFNQTDVLTYTEVFGTWADFAAANPNYAGQLTFQRYSNEAMLQVPSNETSYPWRDIKTYLLLDNTYTDAALDTAVDDISKKIRSTLEATSGFGRLQVYVNYDHGDEGVKAKYGSSVERLQALKAKWDPHNLFGIPNPV
ncbi:hypothetical protein BD289DRAFT_439006 [Coniella lustricola]|uniref:FAD-binding PCMH-type domain-containing protein n=1 Tax=Coniella lustricola TaxID=2025994 RepID=A0A2T3A282_9PEZI|nr:hypothetical protein BD289DRAFT_439006 [Coniella lustricola]